MRRLIVSILFFVFLTVAWQEIVTYEVGKKNWSPVLAVTPKAVGLYLWDAFRDPNHNDDQHIALKAPLVTLKRLVIGYVFSIIIGLPLGLITARWTFCADTIGVLALGLQTLPSVCWVPLAVLWFGQTEWAMLFVVIMGSLWSIVIATDNGVRNVPPIYARAARTMGSGQINTWLKVILPASLPFIVSGMKQGWAFAWRSLMAAEISVSILTGMGLGQLLQNGRDFGAMDQVIGIMLIIIFIGLLADMILFSPWERFMHRRWGTGRT